MNNLSTLTFEQAYAELERIISQLDTGNLPLDESVTLYEHGRRLAAHCQTLLDGAELRISRLNDDGSTDSLG